MKYLKLLVCAIIMAFTFGSAKAQVMVKAQIGGDGHGYRHHGHWYAHRHAYWRHHHQYYRYY